MSKKRREATFEIADREGLARLVEEVVAVNHGGVVSQAARVLAEGRSTAAEVGRLQRMLSRIANQKLSSIKDPTYQVLGRLIPPARHDELRRLVLSDSTQAVFRIYQGWLATVSSRAEWESKFRPPFLLGDDEDVFDFMRRASRLKEHMHRAFPNECERLDRAIIRGAHTQARGDLAWHRVLSPLLDHVPSGGVERCWTECEGKELLRFLKAGVAREEILLRRDSDLERARKGGATLDALKAAGVEVQDLYPALGSPDV